MNDIHITETEYELVKWLRKKQLVHPMNVIMAKHPDPYKAIEDIYNRTFAQEDFACRIRELARTLEA